MNKNKRIKTKETINPEIACIAQVNYCSKNNLPYFAPMNCYKCGINIYKKISVERAEKEHITRCPSCGKSFCS